MASVPSPIDDDTLFRRVMEFGVEHCDVDAPDLIVSAVLMLLGCSQHEGRADRAALVLFVHFRDELREALDGRV